MTIKELAKKMRAAADLLDEISTVGYNLDLNAGKLRKPAGRPRILPPRKVEAKRHSPNKGRKYNGSHWTQKPENKERAAAQIMKAINARKESQTNGETQTTETH